MLSPLQKKFPKQQQKTCTKLAPNLYDKKNYVVHHRNLKFYLEQGMEITKIHKVSLPPTFLHTLLVVFNIYTISYTIKIFNYIFIYIFLGVNIQAIGMAKALYRF